MRRNYLLDTHIILWYFSGDKRLSTLVREIFADPENVLSISYATYWEIALNLSKGKLQIDGGIDTFCDSVRDSSIDSLPIEIEDFKLVSLLPFHHRDPFDRLIIAAAMNRNWPVITVDAAFSAYPILTLS